MTFTTEEVATIRRFIAWAEERYVGHNEGITDVSDDGIAITEFDAVGDYDGGYMLERTVTNLPWLALLDPEEYDRQCKAAEEEQRRQWEARQLAQIAAREAEEREQFRRLSIKYGSDSDGTRQRGDGLSGSGP